MSSLKETEKKRKTIYKPILDNPFTQCQFPIIDPEIQTQILHYLLHCLENEQLDQQPQHVTIGFNSTVSRLEKMAQSKECSQISYVFVCKPDIQPKLIISQFPVLCYTASNPTHKVKLVQLPRGSTQKFQEKLGAKYSIIGLQKTDQIPSSFYELLDKVPDVTIPWLEKMNFVKPNIKLLETTIPTIKKSKISKKKP